MTEAPHRQDPAQPRLLVVLAAGQVFGGTAMATSVAASSLVAARLSGSPSVGGAASTAIVLGAAGAAAVVARVAQRRGRRPALAGGYLIAFAGAVGAVLATEAGSAPALLVALLLVGSGTAVGLAARYAATDLAAPNRAGRALALVVWATTVGAVAGPNLLGPLQFVAIRLGLDPATGPYLLCAAAFAAAALVSWAGLRPDPLVRARARAAAATPGATPDGGTTRPWAVLRGSRPALVGAAGIVVGHAVMVGLMSMTPVHMDHGGAALTVVGLVISLHIAGMYALSPVFGRLSDRLGAERVLACAAVLLTVAGVLCALAAPTATALLTCALILLGLGWSAALVGGSALLTASVPVAERPRVQGAVDVAMNLGGAAAGIVAGVLVTVASYAVLGIVAVVVTAPFLLVTLRAGGRLPAGSAAPPTA
ncbi:MFS transporter [Pseudonocardia parietis]|uniref:MFS family permease n=1 Tax=Pseudonocardia parietis TaxID=570936 RepID=A0ABS4W198_9PSEU|nr:MFS transporter [Pseudonocardia parietis]MBP2369980.1 MFS family permease [Pseudonocardia parietis]